MARSDVRLRALRSDRFLPVVLGYTPSAREAALGVEEMLDRFDPRDTLSDASIAAGRSRRRSVSVPEAFDTSSRLRVLLGSRMASGRSLLLIADIGGYTDYMRSIG